MTYYVGQVLPIETLPVVGEDLDQPQWYILRVPPQGELPASAWLARKGIKGAWYPTQTKWRAVRSVRKRVPYEAPVAPGYLFVPFMRAPIWHELRAQAGKKILSVVSDHGWPLRIPDEVIANMKQVPERIAVLREREAERRKIAPGTRADVTGGPLEGWTIEVSRIDKGIAYFVAPLLGAREVAVPLDKLRKIG